MRHITQGFRLSYVAVCTVHSDREPLCLHKHGIHSLLCNVAIHLVLVADESGIISSFRDTASVLKSIFWNIAEYIQYQTSHHIAVIYRGANEARTGRSVSSSPYDW